MSIVSKLFSRKSKTLIDPLVGVNNNQVTIEFDRAFRSLDFNPLYADRIGSYLVSKNPSIDGTVYDETPNRKIRTELTARATSFSTNQRLYGGNTLTGKTALSVFAWVRPTTLSSLKTICSEYFAPSDIGWLLGFDGNKLRAQVSGDGGTANAKRYVSIITFSTNEWVHIGFVFSGGVLTLYINGKALSASEVTKTTDGTVATIHDSSETLEIGSNGGGSAYFEGQIQTPLIWESALSAAEVRDLYLQKYDQVTTPDYGWFLDGVNAYPLTSSSPALTAANTPTRYEDPEAPDYLNLHGWNVGNSGRLAEPLGLGDTITFKVKTTDTSFVFFHQSDNSRAGGFVFGGSTSTTLGNVSSIVIDGEEFSGTTRGELAAAVSDGVEHIVTFTNSTSAMTDTEWNNYGGSYEFTSGYLRPTHINGVPITAADIDFDNTTILAPKRINSNVDSDGAPATDSSSFGECKRNWQLTDGPCIDLNGTNHVGEFADSDSDFEVDDFTASVSHNTAAGGNQYLISYGKFSSTNLGGWTLTKNTSVVTATFRIGAGWENVTTDNSLTDDVEYTFELSKVGTAVTITVYDANGDLFEEKTGTLSSGTIAFGSEDKGAIGAGWGIAAYTAFANAQVWNCWIKDSAGNYLLNAPLSDEVATSSKDKSGNSKHIVWQNSPSVSTQDSFFESEANGCSSVPVLGDGVELNGSSVDYDGIKTAVVELDFVPSSILGTQVLFSNASIGPFRIETNAASIRVFYRTDSNATTWVQPGVSVAVGTLYKLRIELTEDPDNPTTAGTVAIYDRETDEQLGLSTGANIALSYAATNSGTQQIGSYTTASNPFLGDLYRVRHVAGGVEKLLWTANNYLVNQTDDSAVTESGGTLALKKIPALADGSGLDVNGYPLNRPPGAYHHDSQALLEEFPVTDSGSQRAVGYGASFDGASSEIQLPIDVFGELNWKIELVFNAASSGFLVAQNSSRGIYYITSTNQLRVRLGGSSEGADEARFSALGAGLTNTISIERDGSTVSAQVNGSSESVTLTSPSVNAGDTFIGQASGFYLDGWVKNTRITIGGSVVYESGLYKDSLDRSPNCNHGIETNITYLTEARATNLNPTISQINTRAVATDRKLIRLGQQ